MKIVLIILLINAERESVTTKIEKPSIHACLKDAEKEMYRDHGDALVYGVACRVILSKKGVG